MHLNPDEMILWQYGFFKVNSTMLMAWILMVLLAAGF